MPNPNQETDKISDAEREKRINVLLTENGKIARNIIRFNSFDGKIDQPFFDNLREEIRQALDAKDHSQEALRKELAELRSYCMITFGESHPELKKCPHEVELSTANKRVERLEGALRKIVDILGSHDGTYLDVQYPYSIAKQALQENQGREGENV